MATSPRPWTPTERPGDASYTAPVVFHGDHRVDQEESDVSSEDDVNQGSVTIMSPGGKEVVVDDTTPRSGPLRFKSSQALRDDAAAQAPEAQTYQPYRQSKSLEVADDVASSSYRAQRNSQFLRTGIHNYLPTHTPYQASITKKDTDSGEAPSPQSQYGAQDSAIHDDDHLPSNNPYRRSQVMRSDSTDNLLLKPQRLSQAPGTSSSNSYSPVKPYRLSQAQPDPTTEELPSVTGDSTRQIHILLINPNSSRSMTERCLKSISGTLPPNVTVFGFTAIRPAPTAIESQTDAIMSTAACTKAILPTAAKYDAFLVACFSHHPLISALREQLMQPVIGIMEASLYASRMCGSKFGIVTTSVRSMHLHDSSVKSVYGLGPFSVGCESTRLGVLELESLPDNEVEERLATAAKKLQLRGADCICLGCAGMTDLQKACQDAVGMHDRIAMVIDGVAIGVHFLVGLVRENLGTAKGSAYNTKNGHKVSRPEK